MVDKKLVATFAAAASLGFGAGQLVKVSGPKTTVHAVDLRVVDELDGGTRIERKAWGHQGKKDVGPGTCSALNDDAQQHAQQVIHDAEELCSW